MGCNAVDLGHTVKQTQSRHLQRPNVDGIRSCNLQGVLQQGHLGCRSVIAQCRAASARQSHASASTLASGKGTQSTHSEITQEGPNCVFGNEFCCTTTVQDQWSRRHGQTARHGTAWHTAFYCMLCVAIGGHMSLHLMGPSIWLETSRCNPSHGLPLKQTHSQRSNFASVGRGRMVSLWVCDTNMATWRHGNVATRHEAARAKTILQQTNKGALAAHHCSWYTRVVFATTYMRSLPFPPIPPAPAHPSQLPLLFHSCPTLQALPIPMCVCVCVSCSLIKEKCASLHVCQVGGTAITHRTPTITKTVHVCPPHTPERILQYEYVCVMRLLYLGTSG